MHELSLAEELLTKCATLAEGRPVVEVSVRCPAGLCSYELSEAFALLVARLSATGRDACLRQAQLRLQTVPAVMRCSCGFDGELGPSDVAGHIGVCPRCGRVGEPGGSVELVGVTFADNQAVVRTLGDQRPKA